MAESVDMQAYRNHVRVVEILHHLKEDELERFLAAAEIVEYGPGEKVVSQGEPGDYLFAIVQGKADVSFKDLNDDEMFVSSFGTGEIFGEAAIFTTEKRTASVTCAEATHVLRIHKNQLIGYIKDHPHAGNKILMTIILGLLKKLKKANQELAFEKQSDIDFNYADALIRDFMSDI
jgi:CRP/FNR family cyclic AMP-dependent transcriptional regulator